MLGALLVATPAVASGAHETGSHIRSHVAQTEVNKRVAVSFLELGFTQGKLKEAIDKYMGPRYIQHDPLLPDGADGLLEGITPILNKYGTIPHDVKRVVAEGDLVVVHSEVTLGDTRQAVVDIMRLEKGKIVEHWDVLQQVPDPSQYRNDNGMF
ncbi:nuclear transport factor 2 family protein [Streptomyces ipomoeae]|uniref:nuclear transport factor 2 family protein n=1 Tax=Streptomyces ipomoeae TaxID=103232 RepID=UPI0015F04DE1|nr:nuclear transport factor 2 family protein [Streptomyces ipomoeae]MDX2937761.1 nuclear transport factor 2 family protein [Streptomyces ipomoeae]